ncbi:MAG: HD domain-containing protein, partial [Aliivibrio sp.]|nr:HD domain-containing protein [Aliivibrio sp.]
MVAVRGAHLKENEEFELGEWITSLEQDKNTSKKLTEVYKQCQELVASHEEGQLLLWRGREMIEILITLSMDKPTLIAAQLFPLVSSGVLDRDTLTENYNKEIEKLIDGVEEMDAIGQLNASVDAESASSQVDNIRR